MLNPRHDIPVVIPAYEPDERLIMFLKTLRKNSISPIILVNDGSSSVCNQIFRKADKLSDVVLVHKHNYGKGRALKTAFQYVLKHYPECVGVITADSDGQHTVPCLTKIMKQMIKNPDTFILGVRNFNLRRIPWRSRLGNKLTRWLLYYITGTKFRDTQTGLRGIPRSFLKNCLTLSGDRFEFETQVLLSVAGKLPIIEVPIKTIYDSVQNHQTHFNPLKDSIKIYRCLCYPFAKYMVSSFSSFVVDISLFSIFLCWTFNRLNASVSIVLATVMARIISIIYNYILNYKVVFHSSCSIPQSAVRYLVLAMLQMFLSAFCTTGLHILLPSVIVVGLKICVDIVLFLIGYFIQRKYVFSVKPT